MTEPGKARQQEIYLNGIAGRRPLVPVGAEQLTTYKYVVRGTGQTRP